MEDQEFGCYAFCIRCYSSLILYYQYLVPLLLDWLIILTSCSFTPTNSIVTIVFGILWLFMLPIGALFCWFMPAYYAYRKEVTCLHEVLLDHGDPVCCLGLVCPMPSQVLNYSLLLSSFGGTLDKTAAEAAKGAAGNKYVRDATKGAVRAGVSASVAAATSSD